MTQSNIIDTTVHAISTPLVGLLTMISALGMLTAIYVINFFIPSGSAKAFMIMPTVLPVSNIVGISSQTAVLIYQLGDGIINIYTPILGVVLLALSFGKVPFDRWLRFAYPI